MFKFDSKVADELVDGGLTPNEMLFLFGGPNSGKSLLAYQLACQYNSVVINTEIGDPKAFSEFLQPRFEKRFRQPFQLNCRSLYSLANVLGLDIQLITKGQEGKAGKVESNITTTEKFPVLEYIKQHKCDILVLDSITTPIKGAMGSARQNFGARADVISRILGQLSLILDETNVAIVVVSHQSQDKANKFDEGRIWGGDTLAYNAKYVLQLRTPNFKVETDAKTLYKQIRRRRYLGKLESKWHQLPLKKDHGFV